MSDSSAAPTDPFHSMHGICAQDSLTEDAYTAHVLFDIMSSQLSILWNQADLKPRQSDVAMWLFLRLAKDVGYRPAQGSIDEVCGRTLKLI